LWFRNDWASWIAEPHRAAQKPHLTEITATAGTRVVAATHPQLGEYILSCDGEVPLLFTENETNNERLFPGQPNVTPHVKDGINNCVVLGQLHAVNPDQTGTKVAAHYRRTIGAGESATLRLRLTAGGPAGRSPGATGVATAFGPEWTATLAA